MKEIKNLKGLSVAMLLRPGLTNANSGENMGNEVGLKTYNAGGVELPYISGQMMRYALREAIAREHPKYFGCKVDAPCCDPVSDPGCDVWGYMAADEKKREEVEVDDGNGGKKKKTKTTPGKVERRTSPVKVQPALGLLADSIVDDFLVRYPRTVGIEPAPVNQKLTYNVFKWGLAVDYDHVAFGPGFEKPLPIAERKARVLPIINAVCDITDVAKQSRLLADLSPKIVIGAASNRHTAEIMSALNVDDQMNVDVALLDAVLADMAPVAAFYAGVIPGVFRNTEAVVEVLNKHCTFVGTPRAAMSKLVEAVKNAE